MNNRKKIDLATTIKKYLLNKEISISKIPDNYFLLGILICNKERFYLIPREGEKRRDISCIFDIPSNERLSGSINDSSTLFSYIDEDFVYFYGKKYLAINKECFLHYGIFKAFTMELKKTIQKNLEN